MYPNLDSLGPHAHQRMRKALVTMFHASTWFPKFGDPAVCLQSISNTIDTQIDCPDIRSGPLRIRLTKKGIVYHRLNRQCYHRKQLWHQIMAILTDGFAGLYIDSSPKAAIVAHHTTQGLGTIMPWSGDFAVRSWFESFKSAGLRVDTDDSDLLLGRWNGASVMYPSVLNQLRTSSSSHLIYQLTDGCFIHNDKYFEHLEAGVTGTSHHESVAAPGLAVEPQDLRPFRFGSRYSIDWTLTESYAAIRIWARMCMDNCITELNLADIIRGYERAEETTACNHPFSTPLKESLLPYVRIPSNIFERQRRDGQDHIYIYMAHQDPQLQFLCFAHNSGVEQDLFYMRNSCINCAIQEVLYDGIMRHGIIVF